MAYERRWDEYTIEPRSCTINGTQVLSNIQRLHPQVRIGSKCLDWKEKIARGENATTAYTLNRSKIVRMFEGQVIDNLKHTSFGYPRTEIYKGCFPGWVGSTPTRLTVDQAKVNSMALSRAYKKIERELQHMNSPAVLAEILDVFRQFGRPFEAIVNLHHRHLNKLYLAKRGLKGSTTFKKLKWKDILANTWLETSFGLIPMMQDSKDIAETFARWQLESELPQRKAKIVARALDSVATTVVQLDQRPTTQMSTSFDVHIRKETECRVQYVCGLTGIVDAAFGSNDRLLQLLGFNPGSWAPAVYEAIPWSWLLDYFTNVQQILEAGCTSTSQVKWISKTVIHKTTETRVTKCSLLNKNSGVFTRVSRTANIHGAGSIKFLRTEVDRTDPGTLGIPSLYFEHPFENYKKVANMAAVLLGRRDSSHQLWLF